MISFIPLILLLLPYTLLGTVTEHNMNDLNGCCCTKAKKKEENRQMYTRDAYRMYVGLQTADKTRACQEKWFWFHKNDIYYLIGVGSRSGGRRPKYSTYIIIHATECTTYFSSSFSLFFCRSILLHLGYSS